MYEFMSMCVHNRLSVETGGRRVGARALGGMGRDCRWTRVSFWSGGDTLQLVSEDVAQLCEYSSDSELCML